MRDNRARRKANRILVDGWRETRCALRAGLTATGIFYCEQSIQQRTPEELHVRERFSEHAVHVSSTVMQKISYGQSDRGVVAEFEAPDWDLGQLTLPSNPLVLVLDCLEKPGNLGAAFRCADAVGVDAVILVPESSDRFNPNAIRSSLGAVFTVPSAVAEESVARNWLAKHGVNLFAARVESSQPMWNTEFGNSTAIVIGSEANGLASHWQSDERVPVHGTQIPMAGQVDSLNASVSAALLLYEAKRQRDC